MRRTRLLLFAAAVAALSLFALAACGGGGGGGGETSNGGGAADGVIVIEMGPGFKFVPNEITVTQGEEVTLLLKNVDSIEHNLEISEFGIDQDVAAGEEVEVTFTPDQAGEFEFVCNIPGHTEGGMVGTLIVQ